MKKKKISAKADGNVPEKTSNKRTSSKETKQDKQHYSRQIVCSRCDNETKEVLATLCETLGDAVALSDFAPKTTHVILGQNLRTIKALTAIAHGLWLLSKEWIFKCVEGSTWLNEKEYEVSCFPGAKSSRLSNKEPLLFNGMSFFIGPGTTMPRQDLICLIEAAGGESRQTNSAASDICVSGSRVVIPKTKETKAKAGKVPKQICNVTELWVFDSLSQWKLLPTKDYVAVEIPKKKALPAKKSIKGKSPGQKTEIKTNADTKHAESTLEIEIPESTLENDKKETAEIEQEPTETKSED